MEQNFHAAKTSPEFFKDDVSSFTKPYQLVYIANENMNRDLGTIGCKLVAAQTKFSLQPNMSGGGWVTVWCTSNDHFQKLQQLIGV